MNVSVYCKELVDLWFHSVALLLILEWNPFLTYSCRHLGAGGQWRRDLEGRGLRPGTRDLERPNVDLTPEVS